MIGASPALAADVNTGVLVLAIAAVATAVVAWTRLYNRLVAARNSCDNAFATIDVQLKLRCDLVPRVVDAVRAYMQHERGVLDELTALRSRALADGVDAATRVTLDGRIGSLLTRVLAVAEQYPDLKAARPIALLQRTLNEVEAQIAAARRTYNAAATDYNTQIESFPAVVAARALGFRPRAPFEASDADREPVRVSPLGGE